MTDLPGNVRWQLWIVAFGFFMQSLDTSIVNTALPSMAKSLGESPLLGPALGGVLVEYASWHWIFLINLPVGIIGAIATLALMPNDKMQTRRFDFFGFVLLAVGMATLTLALDGQKGLGMLVAVGIPAIFWYLWHARGNEKALFSLLFMAVALMGWYYALPLVLFCQGIINAVRFSSMNTLTLKDLPDALASSGNSLLSMIMQLSMSIGVTLAGLLLGMYGQHHISVDTPVAHQVFLYTYISMAVVIALPAVIFARVPNDTTKNVVIRRGKRSSS